MKIMQNDIFGQLHDTLPEKEKKQSMAVSKNFPSITLNDGLNETEASANAMLIHKILEKRLINGGLGAKLQQEIFQRVINNELSIKSGQLDPATATRDSLIAFFVMPCCISK